MTTILETTGYRAPLALRATDSASGAAVGDGLVAVAWQAGDPTSARTARPSPFSALLGFPTLPGLRTQEYAKSQGATPPVWPAPSPKPFVVTLTDSFGRYLPEVFALTAPQVAPVGVVLYSSPARPRPPGWGAVSGEISVSAGGGPAGWALIDISDGTTTYSTVADQAGRFLQYLPYPEALPALAGTPPVGNGIGDVTWTLTCTVHYEPVALRWPVSPAPDGPPDVYSIRSQNQAQIATGGGNQPSLNATLHYGTPLTLALSVVPA